MHACIFCAIAAHDAPADFVFEDDTMMAFADIRPKAPVHILVMPKRHVQDLHHCRLPEDAELLGRLMLRAAAIAQEKGIGESGYKVITNIGDDGGQMIPHFHLHVIGGEPISVVV